MNYSICLIAKNESKTLPRLLASLTEFRERGGEVVLVDTGSEDNTAQLARDWGCKVEEVGPKFIFTIDEAEAAQVNQHFIVDGEEPVVSAGSKFFNFAEARNYAASLASNDMISCFDCDEVATRMDIDRLNQLIAEGIEQFEYHFVFAHDKWGNEAVKFVQSKFYDRRKIKWVGIVHEVLQGDAKRLFLDESIFKLDHYQVASSHRSNYLPGLAYDCYTHPDKDRNSHYFAREMMWSNRPKSAIKEFERHIKISTWVQEKAESMIFIGDCLGKLGEGEQQLEWYMKAFALDHSRREALIRLAGFYKQNQDPQAVACYMAAALQIPWSGFYATNMADYQYVPHEFMYWAKGWLGDIESAREHLAICLEYGPLNSDYLRDYRYYNDLPKVSIVLPSLGRPDGLARCLLSIGKLNYPQDKIEIKILEGEGTVPEKVKQGVEQTDGEWICFASNDIEFTPDSLILALLQAGKENKALMAFNTGPISQDEGNICEHFIIKREFLPQLENSEIFSTDFHHVGCDNWLWAQAAKLNEAGRCPQAEVAHHHFSKGADYDDIYRKGWSKAPEDRQLLKEKLATL